MFFSMYRNHLFIAIKTNKKYTKKIKIENRGFNQKEQFWNENSFWGVIGTFKSR